MRYIGINSEHEEQHYIYDYFNFYCFIVTKNYSLEIKVDY